MQNGSPTPNQVLDVAHLRTFVAIAECGGFHRAARALHLSQPTVSQHVKRLEAVVGRPLTQRDGRRSRLTPTGELLLGEARRLLAVHDEALLRLGATRPAGIALGATEHAADRLLPALSAAVEQALDGGRVQFRLDRGARLRDALDRGDLDLGLLLGDADDELSTPAGALELRWFAAPGWVPPVGAPLPLVAFAEPCAVRSRALATLAADGREASVVCDAAYLGGVLAAARAGLGVALLATVGRTPEGLQERTDLPGPAPLPVCVRSRRGLRPEFAAAGAHAVRAALADDASRIATRESESSPMSERTAPIDRSFPVSVP